MQSEKNHQSEPTNPTPDSISQSNETPVVEVLVPGLPKSLFYSSESKEHINGTEYASVGSQVSVEVGSKLRIGWVIRELSSSEAEEELQLHKKKPSKKSTQETLFAVPKKSFFKPITSAVPGFRPEQLELFRWIADYYGAGLAEVIENAIPRIAYGRSIKLYSVTTDLSLNESEVSDLLKRSKKQKELYEFLQNQNTALSAEEIINSCSSASKGLLTALEKKGLIGSTKSTRSSFVKQTYPKSSSKIKLNEAQQKAVTKLEKAINSKEFAAFLLFGVTGSGKTEVYIRAIASALAAGGSALLVVPEISLTPQISEAICSRFPEEVAVLHSQMNPAVRWDRWQRILSGEIRLVIGARSAIFAPLKNLKLLIVDEEHESSYKQSDGLRYQGRDTAVMRARFEKASVILGSATPSFESLLNAQSKKYRLLQLPERVNKRAVPKIEIIDMSKVKRSEMPCDTITPLLKSAIDETLTNKKQVVILYNRRGFSSYLQCDTCTQVLSCPSCSLSMTFHSKRNILLCHHCAFQQSAPSQCPHCLDPTVSRREEELGESFGALSHRGAGTERVVTDLRTLFPTANIAQMDRDTVSNKDAYKTILDSMRSGEADILVGTQMIAKGHDLSGVTLVGIVDGDIGLHMPDFRSSERIFQLITQAAGRAGRAESPGKVYVQTREAKHPTIMAAASGRFLAFAKQQLDERKALSYPPYAKMMRTVISSEGAISAKSGAEQARKILEDILSNLPLENKEQIRILGPAPAAYERLRGRYRWHILVKSDSSSQIATIARGLLLLKKSWNANKSDIRLTIDIDPVDML